LVCASCQAASCASNDHLSQCRCAASTVNAFKLEKGEESFRIRRFALTLHASVQDLGQYAFARVTPKDEQNCPNFKVIRA
jgi:hypothetical protein